MDMAIAVPVGLWIKVAMEMTDFAVKEALRPSQIVARESE
jgi:hypothetical protein